MDDFHSCKCKCAEKVRNFKITTYTYDQNCLTRLMEDKCKLPQSLKTRTSCKSPQTMLTILNNRKPWNSSILDYFTSSKSIKKELRIDKSKYALHPVDVFPTNYPDFDEQLSCECNQSTNERKNRKTEFIGSNNCKNSNAVRKIHFKQEKCGENSTSRKRSRYDI